MWQQRLIETKRGTFEVFVNGDGDPLCVTHLYSEFNELGNYFADMFLDQFKVFLVNLTGAGNSDQESTEDELSMVSSCLDLEAIREALGFEQWAFAGHSTGGMLGLVYSIHHPTSLNKVLIGGAAASYEYMNHAGSIYCRDNPHNTRLRELLGIIKSPESSRDERRKAGREWAEMSLYRPEKFDEYYAKPSSGRTVSKRLDYYSYKELPNYDLREQLKSVQVPIFVYGGLYDAQCPYDFTIEIDQLLPNSHLYPFHESNHNPFIEEKDKFYQMVNDFKSLTNAH
ncbi:alpha/beta fold hydrolase [Bacillaceae bacterium W0354]